MLNSKNKITTTIRMVTLVVMKSEYSKILCLIVRATVLEKEIITSFKVNASRIKNKKKIAMYHKINTFTM